MFPFDRDADAKLLAFIRSRLDVEEFALLAQEGGFTDPSDLPVETVMLPLERGEFPQSGHYDIEFAIYECWIDRFDSYSPWMRLYLAVLYLYCHDVTQGGICVESEYCLMAVSAAADGGQDAIRLLSDYLLWSRHGVPAGEGYDDYFCLLSWVMLQRSAGLTDTDTFSDVMAVLAGKEYDPGELEGFSAAEGWQDRWMRLSDSLASGEGFDSSDYRRIIMGPGSVSIPEKNRL
ncbi:hypothetical protein FKV24_001385 [Lysobacter maris]|uniref:Uncharacterized protein n=1 Tax=Marilutibacter maris TaxID=1605891 RepID=A0A508B5I5_9GAMM|nr:hypothetical protein [Lysobacter maris]KAB8198576.1 hypothetical protein FKV24_001385 [Lysobacter maris]